jgi:apolipoprotein N-acyltransferase
MNMSDWTTLRRTALGLALAALSAALFTLAFPPYDLWPLIFVGLVPMLVAQHRVMPRPLSGLAYGVGVGGFFWGYFGDMFQGGPWFMRWLPLFIALFSALVSSRDRAFHWRTGYRWFVLHGAAVWVGVEMIRGFVPMIGVWGFAANALYAQPWLIQPVSIFGIYGLSLLILLVNYGLALDALTIFDHFWRFDEDVQPVDVSVMRRWLIGVLVLSLAWTGFSALRFTFDAPRNTPSIRVAAIHPAFKIETDEGLEQIYDLTRQAADQGAELIVWNEGALPFDPQQANTDELRELAAETEAHLVIGYSVETERGLRNEATVLTPAGEFLGVYGKDHPVAWSGETSLTRGAYPAYKTSLGPIGAIICYDLDFTDTARQVVRNGARLIAAPSYDWPAIAHKHYSHVVFRAVENRVPMVKADVGFDSAIIDARGRIIERQITPRLEQAVLVADVPLGPANAPAIRLGDWIGWLALASTVAFIALDVVTARKEAD